MSDQDDANEAQARARITRGSFDDLAKLERVDREKLASTSEADIVRYMHEEGYSPQDIDEMMSHDYVFRLKDRALMLGHDGYIAEIVYMEGDELMHGLVVNVDRATLHFAGRSIAELQTAFVDTIADYRDWCKECCVEPEPPREMKDD